MEATTKGEMKAPLQERHFACRHGEIEGLTVDLQERTLLPYLRPFQSVSPPFHPLYDQQPKTGSQQL